MKQYLREHWANLKILSLAYRTALHWGIFILGGLLILLWLIVPYLEWRTDQQSRIQQALDKAARLQALQRSIKDWKAAQEQTKAQFEKQLQGSFNASSYAQAQQDMYQVTTQLLKQYRLQLISQSLVESNPVDVGEQISLQLNIQGDLADVIDFVDSITRHQKILVFKRLYIAKTSQNALLQITLAGYRIAVKNP